MRRGGGGGGEGGVEGRRPCNCSPLTVPAFSVLPPQARALAQAGTAVVIGGGFTAAETAAVVDAVAGMGAVLEARNPALAALVKGAAGEVGAGNHTVDYESYMGALVKALPSAQYADAVVQSVLDVVGIAFDDYILSVAPTAPREGLPTLLAATLVAAPVALLEASGA